MKHIFYLLLWLITVGILSAGLWLKYDYEKYHMKIKVTNDNFFNVVPTDSCTSELYIAYDSTENKLKHELRTYPQGAGDYKTLYSDSDNDFNMKKYKREMNDQLF